MYQRMLRAVGATAFSTALALGAFSAVEEISWTSTPASTAGQAVTSGEISWTSTPSGTSGTSVQAADSGEISWTVSPASLQGEEGDIEWGSAPAGFAA